MKHAVSTVITLAVASIAVAGIAAPTSHKMAPKATAKKISMVCPITGEKVHSIKEAAGHSTYKGTTYYFCCAGCKPMFDKNPGKYAK